jgi:serine protease DegQ
LTYSRTIASGLVLLLVGFPARAEDKPKESPKTETSFEIPYKLTDSKHVMVRVKLNGKGPFNFILDTGAPALIMTEAVAKKAGAKIEKDWGTFKLDVEGGVTIPEAKGIAMDMFQLKGMNAMGIAGVELHGVIGYNTLAKFRIQYDFTQDKLIWTPLKFDPPELKRLGGGDKGQGGMEIMGDVMKFLAPLLGLKPNFAIKPRGFLGLELEEKKGDVFVKSLVKDGPADKAGLMIGDRIEFAHKGSVDSIEDVLNAVGKMGEGDKVLIRIKRDGEKKDVTIELGKGL